MGSDSDGKRRPIDAGHSPTIADARSADLASGPTHTPGPFGDDQPERDLASGDQVGEYVIEQVIGRGGFGTVYRAVQPVIGKRVAIKVLSRRYSADREMVSRFIAEARAVNQIRHRHIIDIFSFGQLADGRQYYVMEHLEGEPLDQYLAARGPLTLDEALPILRAIARALDAAHAKGIAHRDLKPENIFIARDTDGEGTVLWPKLLDFGIAKLSRTEDQMAHKTGTGVPIGTPYYMSPEQCRGRDVDHRTDIYSFGVLTFRVLTGTYPFDGDLVDILHKQIHEEPPAASSRNPAIAEDVDRAIAWMMQKDPNQRPHSVIAAVAAVQGDKSPTPMLTPVPSRSSMGTGMGKPAAAATMGAGQAPTRRRWLLPVIAIVLAGAGFAAVAVVRSTGTKDPPAQPAPPVTEAVAQQVPATPPIDAAPVAPPPIDAAAVSALVTLTIEGAPDGTEVLLGGEVVGVTPTPVQLKRGTSPVSLVFRAPRHYNVSQQITPDRDQTLRVELRKRRTGAATGGTDGNSLADPFKK